MRGLTPAWQLGLAETERIEIMRKYSLQRHHGNWVMRWSVYKDGKRTQPTHIVASLRNYPKKADMEPLASAYFTRVQRSRTVQAVSCLPQIVASAIPPRYGNLR